MRVMRAGIWLLALYSWRCFQRWRLPQPLGESLVVDKSYHLNLHLQHLKSPRPGQTNGYVCHAQYFLQITRNRTLIIVVQAAGTDHYVERKKAVLVGILLRAYEIVQ